jgi:hypothetical protein
LGHIIDSATIVNDYFLGFTKTTYDDKILIFKSNYISGQFNPTLFKLNQDLEQDSFYTTPFIYDSLCPYQIASDTIVPDDCGVIVGVEEPGGREAGKQGGLEVWPNPCQGVLSVKCLGLSAGKDYNLSIYDIFGRQATNPDLLQTGERGSWRVDVSAMPSGIYFAVVREGPVIKGSAKFIVAK